jgi:hypothetical protein
MAKATPFDQEVTAEDIRKALRGGPDGPPDPPPAFREGEDPAAWLDALWASLWQTHRNQFSHNPIERRGWKSEHRRMTVEEWFTVQSLIKTQGYVCSARNACMGFGCGMTVYAEADPVYPGVPLDPKVLIDITQNHLPMGPGQDRIRFDDAWDVFSPFTHSDSNKAKLKANRLPEARSKGHYEY